MVHSILLVTHVLAGGAGLLLGPLVMRQDSIRIIRGHCSKSSWSPLYRAVVLVVCFSAIGLVAENRPELWALVPLSVATFVLAALAKMAAERNFQRGWLHAYVHGQGGSYIALVTAFVVVALTVDGPVKGAFQLLPWLLPTLLGTVAIELWRRRLSRATSTTTGGVPVAR